MRLDNCEVRIWFLFILNRQLVDVLLLSKSPKQVLEVKRRYFFLYKSIVEDKSVFSRHHRHCALQSSLADLSFEPVRLGFSQEGRRRFVWIREFWGTDERGQIRSGHRRRWARVPQAVPSHSGQQAQSQFGRWGVFFLLFWKLYFEIRPIIYESFEENKFQSYFARIRKPI